MLPTVLQTAYEVIQPLGSGGMSNVWLVRDLACNRLAVMKTLTADMSRDPDVTDRFRAENRILARLSHPNVVQLYGVFLYKDQRAMVMEYIDGITLADYRLQRTLTIRESVSIAMQILSALAYAHKQGVTHRDIKPTNIMMTKDGTAKLVDFGISKCVLEPDRTYPGTTMGSAHYMPPEQILGAATDARSDLYSVGIVLYELLTSVRPFCAESAYAVMQKHLKVNATSPSKMNPRVPKALSNLILKAISKRLDERFQSADEFIESLRAELCRLQKGAAVNAPDQSAVTLYRPAKSAARVRIHVRFPEWLVPALHAFRELRVSG